MTTNAGYEYKNAELKFIAASTSEEKLAALEEMLRFAPKHKSSENMLANLKTRYTKLKKEIERGKANKKGGHSLSIKKEGDAQVTIIGAVNSGKSSLLAALTNAKPKISDIPFTTTKPEIGTLDLEGIKIQLIELPAYLDDKEMMSVSKTSDFIIVLVTSVNELLEVTNALKREAINSPKLIVISKCDALKEEELNKLKPFNLLKASSKTSEGLEKIKQKIFENISLIRVYTKEPGKKPKLDKPLILRKNESIKDMAETIRKDFVKRFVKARIWGRSAKFDGQTVGIEHILQDKDIVELYIK